MKQTKPRIIFFGTPEFSVRVVEKLWEGGYPVAAIVTAPDAPLGRKQILTPPPVKVWAGRHGIEVMQPEILANSQSQIANSTPDLGAVAAYGKIIPGEILAIPKYGFLNVHPSLLPKYRGPTPIESAILAGETKSGVTIHLTTETVDAGPVLAQQGLQIKELESAQELTARLAQLGAELLMETIPQWLAGKIEPKEQNDGGATYTKKFSREDGRVDWQAPSGEIERKVRALNPEPGTFVALKQQIKVLKVSTGAQKSRLPPGTFFETSGKLAVTCGDGETLLLDEVQPAGGRAMSGGEFLRGNQWIIK